MTRNICLPILFAGLVGLAACAKAPEPTASAGHPDAAAVSARQEVRWFSGTIDEAFAAARSQHKPLFVYWGAEWCPYCKELQATIFVRDEFVEMSRQFIALDMSNGNFETILEGDRYKIYGLPTVIVFDPNGQEITRIPGGMDMEQYAAVLELTLNAIRPVGELVAAVEAGNELADNDWRLLAGYSWSQDRGQALGEREPGTTLQMLASNCPQRLAVTCSTLHLDAAGAWLQEPADQRDPSLAAGHLGTVQAILANPDQAQANLASLAELGSDIVSSLASGETQTALQADLLALYARAIENADVNVLNRAGILLGWADLATELLGEGETLPAEQIAWARAQADKAVAELGPYQQHAGVNRLWGVYYDIGLTNEARATLAYGMEVSKAPYYFMSAMAYIEREAGNDAIAIDWYRKAWDTTRQPAHRARWGSGYVRRLVQLTPDNIEEIHRASSVVLQEMAAQTRGLEAYQHGLARLSSVLLEWSAEDEARDPVVVALRSWMDQACAGMSEDGSTAELCSSFLKPPALAKS